MDSGVEITNDTGVGALLKASRQRCGENLQDVADQLRIRYSYLQALEEGRVKELPGQTYAVGFVRAYAEHLGLDANEVVRRFKLENQKANTKLELAFPTPMPEGGVPGAAIMLVGVVIAGLAYGGWYLNTVKEGLFEEYIAPLPDRLVAMLPPNLLPNGQTQTDPMRLQGAAEPAVRAEPSPASATAALPARTDAGNPPAALPVEAPAAAPLPAETPAPAASAPPAPAPAPVPAAKAKPASEAAPAAPAVAPAPPAIPVAPVVMAAIPPVQQPAAPVPVPPQPPAASVVPQAPATAVVPPAPLPPEAPAEVASVTPDAAAGPRVYGTENADSRILLRARSDSWVQIRDAEKRLVMTRLLKAGDSYHVPDQPGLTLVTGNAGALEVLVDGAAVPPVGAVGAVRKNIILDPEKLVAGTAAPN